MSYPTKRTAQYLVRILSALLPLLFACGVATKAQTVTATVSVGSGPNSVAVNPVTNKMYVTNPNSNNVTVIDGATNTTATVATGTTPVAASVNTVTNKIYISNAGSSNVTVIDGATNTTTTVATGANPDSLAVNPITNKIYVSNQVSGTVTVIDGATNATTTITVGAAPLPAVVNPVTNKVYVANNHGGTVTVIDGATNATTTVTVGAGPDGLALNPVTNKIYVPNFNTNNVTVIDGATNATSTVAVGTNPFGVALNPVTNQIYIANSGSSNVTVIDGSTNNTTTVAAGTDPMGVAVNPVTNTVFVTNTNSNNMTVINGATNAATTVTVGAAPDGVAANPVTGKIYVANTNDNTVTVIDGATNATVGVSAGSSPSGVAVNPATNQIYVTNSSSGTVTVIDGATNNITAVTVGTTPSAVAVNPVTNQIYVANSGSNNVTVIDGATNATTTVTDPSATAPGVVTVNPATNRIYVGNKTSNNVTVIDGTANAIVTTVAFGGSPEFMAVNSVTNKIYVINNSNNMVVIDGATDNITVVGVGPSPAGVAVNPVTNQIYVPNSSNRLDLNSTVTVIDGATNSSTAVTAGLNPFAVDVNPVTNQIYVANRASQTVTVLDGATNVVTATLGVGINPEAVAVNPVTNKIYIVNNGNATVSIIDGATNTLEGVGNVALPFALAVNPVTSQIYVTNSIGGSITVITEQQVQPIPLTTTITPLAGNQTTNPTPTFTFTATSTFAPTAPPVDAVYFQFDTWQGPWIPATMAPGARFSGTAPTLSLGTHILYAYATDGQDATSIMTTIFGGSSPVVGAISSYLFVVNGSVGTLNVDLLNNGSSGVGTVTDSTGQINCTNTGGELQSGSCTATYPVGMNVTFTETPGAGSIFTGWQDSCGTAGTAPTCTLTTTSFGTVLANFGNGPGTFTLNVTPGTGETGGGQVSSQVGADGTINCTLNGSNATNVCSATPKSGSVFVLSEVPNATSSFTGWSGACSGTGSCVVTMSQNQTVSPTFTATNFALTVMEAGTGTGTVMSTPAGISCPATCSANFTGGSQVTLTETPANGSTFTRWGGACSGTGACTVTMNAVETVTANFSGSSGGNFTINVAAGVGATGSGTVTDNAGNIDCVFNGTSAPTGTCSASVAAGTVEMLTATPRGSVFNGWSDACTGTTTCMVTMLQNETVVATFTAVPAFTGAYGAGDIFVSGGDGFVYVFSPGGTLLGSMNTGQSSDTGSAFDRFGNFYVTIFEGLASNPPVGIVKFDQNANLVGAFGNYPAGAVGHPESVVFNMAGDLINGVAQDVINPTDPVYEFDSSGNLIATFNVVPENRGSDWVELLADQKTLLYTSEGLFVHSFNISTNTQNPDVNASNPLPGNAAYAFRVLPNGNLLIADTTSVVELSPTGTTVQTYTPNPGPSVLFALNLDPDGVSFWTADGVTGIVYKFNIASGAQLTTFTSPNGAAAGLAVFGEKLVGTNNLTVTVAGSGTGTVTSTPSGISCPSSCLAPFPDNSNVTLTATAAEGPTFAGFSSNCVAANPQTNPPSCKVPIGTTDVTVTATFNSGTGVALMVTEAGTGTGTVTSSPAGINCPTTCSANFASGTAVTLTAFPADGSTFTGWTGGGCSGTGTCVVTVTAATAVTATFNSGNTPVIISVASGSSSTVNTVPGGSAVFGLVLTGQTGFTGTVQLTCSSPIASITCAIVPSSVTLNGTTTSVAIVVNTFCKGFIPNDVPNGRPTPGGFGTGLGLLLVALSLCGAAWTYKKQPRWAVSFGLLIILGVGMSACSNLAKSPSGSATPPGSYPLVVTATPPSGAASHVNLILVVK